MDPDGLRIGNALVGNPDGLAGLEIAQGELALQLGVATVMSVIGAATLRLDGVELPPNTAFLAAKGSRLEVSSSAAGRFALSHASFQTAMGL